jgi:phage terminase large subunit-like protein
VPSGEGAGGTFKLREWQRRFIRDVYEPHNEHGRRQVRRAVLSIARKNGKTALIAALVLAHLVGPEAIQNGEIYSAANDREQAAQVFKVAAQIVRADPELDAILKVVDSTKTIACYGNGSVYRAISAEAGTKHGLNPSLVIYDELAQAKNRDLFDVLDTAMGARAEPLFVTISTQSNDPEHILSQLIDDGQRAEDPTTVTHLYAVDDETEDIFDEAVWYDANPALGDFRSMEDLRTMADRARRMPSFEASFRNLYLNQRVDAQSPLIPRPEWKACQVDRVDFEPGEPVYLGLDLSGKRDLTALVMVSAERNDDRVRAWFWKPKETLEESERAAGAPYRLWADQGWIDAVSNRTIDYALVAQTLGELAATYDVQGVAFDRWRIDDLLKELEAEGVPSVRETKAEKATGEDLRLVDWGQGYRDMAPAVDALEASILERRFQHDGNPVLTMCFANATTQMDPTGSRKLVKTSERLRIDGAVAAAMAIGLKSREIVRAEPTSPWEDPTYSMAMV